MKRLLCTVLTLCLLGTTAFADIAWEPENSFYARNQRKCEPEERVYWVNGAEGFVTAREEPEGKPLGNLKNGALRYVYGTYERDGVRWGLINVSADREPELFLAEELDGGWHEVWVPMEEMVLRYDHQSFLEEFANEVRETGAKAEIWDERYCVYSYPCGELLYQAKSARDVLSVTADLFYTDSEGRDWICVSYLYGDRNVWLCLDDVENPDLQAEGRTPELIPAAESAALPEWSAPPDHTLLYAGIGVAAVCAVTTALLVRMKKKKE